MKGSLKIYDERLIKIYDERLIKDLSKIYQRFINDLL
jgi:hypothetical protein